MQMSFHLSIKYKKILKQFSPFIIISAQPGCSITGTIEGKYQVILLQTYESLEGTFKHHLVQKPYEIFFLKHHLFSFEVLHNFRRKEIEHFFF